MRKRINFVLHLQSEYEAKWNRNAINWSLSYLATDSHLWNICSTSFYREHIFINIEQFSSGQLFSFIRKKATLRTICLHFQKISNIQYRGVIKFFTRRSQNATEISKKLNNIYKDDAPSYPTVTKWVAEFKEAKHVFEDSPRTARPSTITIDQNIETVERIVMSDQQISVCCLAYELSIATTIVYEIINNHLGMKKVSTKWVTNIYSTFSHCCQELLQESRVNSDNYFHRIVTNYENWLYYYDPLSEEEGKWTNSNSASSNKASWKDHDGNFLGQIWYSAERIPARWNFPTMHQSSSGCAVPFWRHVMEK